MFRNLNRLLKIPIIATPQVEPLFCDSRQDRVGLSVLDVFGGWKIIGSGLSRLSVRFTMSTMAKDNPIPVDDESVFLRQIVDLSPALLHTARPDGYLDFFNQRWLAFAGVPLEKMLGWGWTSCIYPEDVEAFLQKMRESFANGKPFQETSRVRRADGVYRWMLHQKVPIFDGGGHITKWYGSSIDIDDRKRAEEQLVKSVQELQRSEFYLAEAQRLGHIGSWVFDPATGFEHWSRELFQIHGLDPGKGPPNSEQYLTSVHPQDREFMASLMKRMLLDDSGFDVTKRIVRAGGEVRYVRCVGTAASDNAGSRRIGVSIDVTDHEVLTQELRRRESHLAEAQRLGQIGSWVFEPTGAFEYWSDELFRIYGLDPGRDAPTLDEYLACVHQHDREFMALRVKQAIAEASGCDVTQRIVRPDGEVRYIRCVGAPVLENGTLKRIVGSAIDVTEHELLTRELRRREAYLSEAQRLSHTGSFGWKPRSGEIAWSDETYRIFECNPAEKVALDLIMERVHPEDRNLVLELIERASSSGSSIDCEHRLLLPDNQVKHVRVLTRLLEIDSDELEFAGAVIDITEAKRAEDHLRDTRIKLAKASRLATVAELAGSIAHELNQPLMSILANAQAAKKWLNAGPSNLTEANLSIERIIRDARAADETMQHIRALFKQESFDKKDVNIPEMLLEVVRFVQEDPKKRRVPIECRIEESLPTVHVDQIQIQQVFINLIVNAIEALEGQQVAPLLVLRAATDSDRLLIQVIDNGPGVDDPDRIFDAFMTTKENGMGIGLAVSRSTIEAHGGRLWAENNKTGGATFNVALPLTHMSRIALHTQESA